jgi:hypothetical protein
LQHWEAEAPNAIMGWTMFQPRREQWTRQRYQMAPPGELAQPPAIRERFPTDSSGALYQAFPARRERQRNATEARVN